MEPQQPVTHRTDPDDVEGHASRVKFADAERDETDDVAGHLSGVLGSERRTEEAG